MLRRDPFKPTSPKGDPTTRGLCSAGAPPSRGCRGHTAMAEPLPSRHALSGQAKSPGPGVADTSWGGCMVGWVGAGESERMRVEKGEWDTGGPDATLTAEPPSSGPTSPEPRSQPVQAWGQVHGSRGCPSPGPPGTPRFVLGKPVAAPSQAPGCREDAAGSCRGPAVPPSPCHLLCMKVTARNFILILYAPCVRELL